VRAWPGYPQGAAGGGQYGRTDDGRIVHRIDVQQRIAFLALTLSTLGLFKSLGPALAIAVAVTLIAGLTLIPAILSPLGPRVFWPWKAWRREPTGARLGFAATLGSTVLIFQQFDGQPRLIFLLPIIMYLFVVALGTDYNILMIARLRGEAREGRTPREAAAMTVRHAGPTVAAAGLILNGLLPITALPDQRRLGPPGQSGSVISVATGAGEGEVLATARRRLAMTA
jgi:uncharacterized membrane protein YdfJ with MMPL/SSD domain